MTGKLWRAALGLLLLLTSEAFAVNKKINLYIDAQPGVFSRFHVYDSNMMGKKTNPKMRWKYMGGEWVKQKKGFTWKRPIYGK